MLRLKFPVKQREITLRLTNFDVNGFCMVECDGFDASNPNLNPSLTIEGNCPR